MCGITGFINLNGAPASSVILKKMTDKIAHRGPDGEGQWGEGNVGIGHRRLAILDLSPAGHQPMSTEDNRFVISYNGEVYNFSELRTELEALGHRFYSRTDTEVVLKSFAQWGRDSLGKFNGMFAFAVWDRVGKQLFFARDRYGIKPLYYWRGPGALVFGSEIKAIMAYPGFRGGVDIQALPEYLTFQNFFTDRTLFEGVRILPAGSWMTVDAHGVANGPQITSTCIMSLDHLDMS